MRARLAYSVAFLALREVLVLDEVFAVGDVGFREKCKARYRELIAAGHSSILVSHDVRDVAEFCPRAVLLDGARVALEGTGEEVVAAYLQRVSSGEVGP